MSGVQILQAIIEIMVGGFVGIGQAIGQALSTMATSIFLTTVGTGSEAVTSLSTFAILIIVFAAISLALSLTRWVLNFVTSFGNRNR